MSVESAKPALPDSGPAPNPDPFCIGSFTLPCRLILGTGRYDSFEQMQQCVRASGTGCVTVAIRRERQHDSQSRNILDFIDLEKIVLLPNTAGAYEAETALRYARMGREILKQLGNPGAKWIKLEVLGDTRTLLPDPIESVRATEQLVKEGFDVLCYTNDDPVTARRLKDAGAVAVMPAGSPIGSGLGIVNENNLRMIMEDLKRGDPDYPLLVDAGIGTASDAARAMELGFDGVLLNTAVALAANPGLMAGAMNQAVSAGRAAYLAGRMEKSSFGSNSSPDVGVISSRDRGQ